MADKPAPQFAIMDTVADKFLSESGGAFILAKDHTEVTLYADEIDAEWARMNAGGETKVVKFNPIPGITEGY